MTFVAAGVAFTLGVVFMVGVAVAAALALIRMK